jgi:hypothetical protein
LLLGWIPAFAGMTEAENANRNHLSGDLIRPLNPWIHTARIQHAMWIECLLKALGELHVHLGQRLENVYRRPRGLIGAYQHRVSMVFGDDAAQNGSAGVGGGCDFHPNQPA